MTPGEKYGKLTLLQEAPRRNGRRYWECLCDCGKQHVVQESHLKSGHTQSCGCLNHNKKKSNAADLTGKRFGRLTVLEITDRRKKGAVVWRCRCDCGKEVFCETELLNRGRTRSCGCLLEEQRKINMRNSIHFTDGTCIEKIACQKEIATNKSGHRGVWQRENRKWRAGLTFRGKTYNFGTFETYEEAVAARVEGERMITDYLARYYASQENALG